MTKDRLDELRRVMQESLFQDGELEAEKSRLSPLVTFFEHARAIKLQLECLKNRVDNLKTLLSDQQQWSNLNTRKELEHRIEEEKLVIGSAAKTIRNNLKAMKQASGSQGKSSSTIQRIKDVQLNSVLSELNEVLRDYLNCLVQHKEKSVKMLSDMIKVKDDDATDIDYLLEEGKIAIFSNNLLIEEMEEKYKLREVQDKHKEIIKMESSILEIRNLFNELALIVDLQGEKIEEINTVVEENLNQVDRGRTKLESATRKKEKLRYRKLMAALICGGIILIVCVLLTIF